MRAKAVPKQGGELGKSSFIETKRGRQSRWRKLLKVSSKAASFCIKC